MPYDDKEVELWRAQAARSGNKWVVLRNTINLTSSSPVILRSITLRNFRNYKADTLTFHEKFNLILGNNAQGKTNLLEAIHLLFAFRPFKQVSMEKLILLGETESRIKGEIDSDSSLNEVHISLTKGGKTVK
ncbi:MAG: AAA family ATPase, partial [Thermodesulfobacteriota bacterium]